jgi:Amiloride-sensitive sodium channel
MILTESCILHRTRSETINRVHGAVDFFTICHFSDAFLHYTEFIQSQLNQSDRSELFLDHVDSNQQIMWVKWIYATWRHYWEVPCQMILTKWGFCFSFNLLPLTELINMEKCLTFFIILFSDKNFFFLRVELGFQPVEVVLNDDNAQKFVNESPPYKMLSAREFFFLSFYPSEISIAEVKLGVLILVHRTNQLPDDSSFHFRQDWNYSYGVILPQQTLISKEVEKMSPSQRNCFFEHERKLELFRVYSKQNCEHECQSFLFQERCDCVPFYFLRKLII